MNLIEVLPALRAIVVANPLFAPLPALTQLDPEHNKKYEAALRKADATRPEDGPGACLSIWDGGADAASGNKTQLLDLEHSLIVSIAENPKNNTSGVTALEWVHRFLRLVHQHRGDNNGRLVFRHPAAGPVYELGPLSQGLVIYFVHLEVRSIEPVGALTE